MIILLQAIDEYLSIAIQQEWETLSHFSVNENYMVPQNLENLFAQSKIYQHEDFNFAYVVQDFNEIKQILNLVQDEIIQEDFCVNQPMVNPQINYIVENTEDSNQLNAFLATRLNIESKLIRASQIQPFKKKYLEFEFSKFNSIEEGIELSFGKRQKFSTRSHFGGIEQYLLVIMDTKQQFYDANLEALKTILESISLQTQVKILAIGKNVQFITDNYILINEAVPLLENIIVQNVYLTDEILSRVIQAEIIDFTSNNLFKYTQQNNIEDNVIQSRIPKLNVIVISSGIFSTLSQKSINSSRVPITILTPELLYDKTDQQFYDLKYYAQINNLSFVLFAQTKSDYADKNILKLQDNYPFLFYCDWEKPAPQYFQFSDSVLNTIIDNVRVIKQVSIYQAIQNFYPRGRNISWIKGEDQTIIASIPIYKNIKNRGKTLLGFFSIGFKSMNNIAIISHGQIIYDKQLRSLEQLMEINPTVAQLMLNTKPSNAYYIVKVQCGESIKISINQDVVPLFFVKIQFNYQIQTMLANNTFNGTLEPLQFVKVNSLNRLYLQYKSNGYFINIAVFEDFNIIEQDQLIKNNTILLKKLQFLASLQQNFSVNQSNLFCSPDLDICFLATQNLDIFKLFATSIGKYNCQLFTSLFYIQNTSYTMGFKRKISRQPHDYSLSMLPTAFHWQIINFTLIDNYNKITDPEFELIVIDYDLTVVYPNLGQKIYETENKTFQLLFQLLYQENVFLSSQNILNYTKMEESFFYKLKLPSKVQGEVYIKSLYNSKMIVFLKNLYTNLDFTLRCQFMQQMFQQNESKISQFQNYTLLYQEPLLFSIEIAFYDFRYSKFSDQFGYSDPEKMKQYYIAGDQNYIQRSHSTAYWLLISIIGIGFIMMTIVLRY